MPGDVSGVTCPPDGSMRTGYRTRSVGLGGISVGAVLAVWEWRKLPEHRPGVWRESPRRTPWAHRGPGAVKEEAEPPGV